MDGWSKFGKPWFGGCGKLYGPVALICNQAIPFTKLVPFFKVLPYTTVTPLPTVTPSASAGKPITVGVGQGLSKGLGKGGFGKGFGSGKSIV